MKAILLMAAALTSALLTVPTVTSVADAKVVELRLNFIAQHAVQPANNVQVVANREVVLEPARDIH